MKRARTDHETVLGTMDPATARRTRSPQDLPPHARAELDRILSTSREAADTPEPAQVRPASPQRPVRRVLLAAAAVVLLALGLTVPVVTAPAYAGWQQTPEALDAEGTEVAAQECRRMWSDVFVGPEQEGFADPADFRAVLSERRGPYTFTVMRGPQGQFADCVIATSWWSGGGGGGSITPAPPTATPGPDRIDTAVVGALGPSRRTVFGIPLPGQEQSRSYAYGRAGADVAAVVLHTRSQGDVAASVQHGLWAGWWPSSADAPEVGGVRATLTLRDGSTREADLDAAHVPWPGMDLPGGGG